LAKDPELKRLIDRMPELKEQFAQSVDDAKQSLKDIETGKRAQAEMLAQLQKGIEQFMNQGNNRAS